MQIAIRPLENSDNLEPIRQSTSSFLRKYYNTTNKQTFKNQLKEKDVHSLVAVYNQDIVATVSYYVQNEVTNIYSLGVLDEYRKNGITRKLFEHIEDLTKKVGAKKLSLNTIKETGNIMIFEKLGYKVIEEKVAVNAVSPDNQQVHEFRMEKDIKLCQD
jgi:N-acetylglutamate synthase-like GNAT family acetyltransferase